MCQKPLAPALLLALGLLLGMGACGAGRVSERGDGPPVQPPETAKAAATPQPPAQPTDPGVRARIDRAVELYGKGRFADALREFVTAYLDSALPRLHFNIGRCHERLGRPLEALRSYERFLDTDPDLTSAQRSEAESSIARMQKQLGGDAPADPGLLQRVQQATELYERRRYEEALQAFVEAYQVAPLPRLHLHRARCLDRLGQAREAQRAYDLALRTDPNLTTELRTEALEARTRLGQGPLHKPFYKKWPFWTGMAILTVGIATGITLGLTLR